MADYQRQLLGALKQLYHYGGQRLPEISALDFREFHRTVAFPGEDGRFRIAEPANGTSSGRVILERLVNGVWVPTDLPQVPYQRYPAAVHDITSEIRELLH